jgi:hypothetical protein
MVLLNLQQLLQNNKDINYNFPTPEFRKYVHSLHLPLTEVENTKYMHSKEHYSE